MGGSGEAEDAAAEKNPKINKPLRQALGRL
jgi:hypothetical protein